MNWAVLLSPPSRWSGLKSAAGEDQPEVPGVSTFAVEWIEISHDNTKCHHFERLHLRGGVD